MTTNSDGNTMSQWVIKGIRTGIKTTAYPRGAERAAGVTPGLPRGGDFGAGSGRARRTMSHARARSDATETISVDNRRCVHCYRCVRGVEQPLNWEHDLRMGGRSRRSRRNEFGQPFRRSIHILVVDAGDCGACLNEVKQLNNPYYNMHRLGFFITPTPRHADVLLVVGPVTDQMRFALKKIYEAMPTPKRVVAVGACALSGGVFAKSFVCANGVADVLPVDVEVPGNPPPPLAILHGLLVAVGRKAAGAGAGRLRAGCGGRNGHARRSSSFSLRPAAPASCSRWRYVRRTRETCSRGSAASPRSRRLRRAPMCFCGRDIHPAALVVAGAGDAHVAPRPALGGLRARHGTRAFSGLDLRGRRIETRIDPRPRARVHGDAARALCVDRSDPDRGRRAAVPAGVGSHVHSVLPADREQPGQARTARSESGYLLLAMGEAGTLAAALGFLVLALGASSLEFGALKSGASGSGCERPLGSVSAYVLRLRRQGRPRAGELLAAARLCRRAARVCSRARRRNAESRPLRHPAGQRRSHAGGAGGDGPGRARRRNRFGAARNSLRDHRQRSQGDAGAQLHRKRRHRRRRLRRRNGLRRHGSSGARGHRLRRGALPPDQSFALQDAAVFRRRRRGDADRHARHGPARRPDQMDAADRARLSRRHAVDRRAAAVQRLRQRMAHAAGDAALGGTVFDRRENRVRPVRRRTRAHGGAGGDLLRESVRDELSGNAPARRGAAGDRSRPALRLRRWPSSRCCASRSACCRRT